MSFNLEEVFSTVENFLSSGYVLTAVLVVLGIGALKKIMGLLVIGAIAFGLWFLCQEEVSAIIAQVTGYIPQVVEEIPNLVDAVFSYFGM